MNILYEYETINDEKLCKYIKDTPTLHQYFKADFSGIKAQQYCGIINCDGENYYIRLLAKISKEQKDNLNIFRGPLYVYADICL